MHMFYTSYSTGLVWKILCVPVCPGSPQCLFTGSKTPGEPVPGGPPERRVLFDVLQAGWSDSTFSAAWARLEAEEEACAEDGLTVVGTEDRFEDFVGL